MSIWVKDLKHTLEEVLKKHATLHKEDNATHGV